MKWQVPHDMKIHMRLWQIREIKPQLQENPTRPEKINQTHVLAYKKYTWAIHMSHTCLYIYGIVDQIYKCIKYISQKSFLPPAKDSGGGLTYSHPQLKVYQLICMMVMVLTFRESKLVLKQPTFPKSINIWTSDAVKM